jgi:hypothetical protein
MIKTQEVLRNAGSWINDHKLMVGGGVLAAGVLAEQNAPEKKDKDDGRRGPWATKKASWEKGGGGSADRPGGRFSKGVESYIEDSKKNPYARDFTRPGSYITGRA